MYRVLLNRGGIVALQCIEPGVSLFVIAFWRRFVVACSPGNRWIEFARCDGPTALMRRSRGDRQSVSSNTRSGDVPIIGLREIAWCGAAALLIYVLLTAAIILSGGPS